MQMKCHDLYNEKEDVCSMPCEKDADCFDPEAKCQNTKCVPLNAEEPDDETTDEESDSEVKDDENSLEDDPINDDDKKAKKSSGCSSLML